MNMEVFGSPRFHRSVWFNLVLKLVNKVRRLIYEAHFISYQRSYHPQKAGYLAHEL